MENEVTAKFFMHPEEEAYLTHYGPAIIEADPNQERSLKFLEFGHAVHDFNNFFTVIYGYIDFIKENLADKNEYKKLISDLDSIKEKLDLTTKLREDVLNIFRQYGRGDIPIKQEGNIAILAKSAMDLEMLGGLKTRFVSIINEMCVMSKALPKSENKEIQDCINEIKEAIRKCGEEIAALSEEGKTKDVNMAKWLHKQFKNFRTIAGKCNIKMDIRSRPDARINSTKFYLLVANLVRNAGQALAEAGTNNGQIVISLSESKSGPEAGTVLVVTDNGPGMKEGQLREFSQAHKVSSTKGENGNGFGISGAYVELEKIGGKLELKNSASGGLSAIITLPEINPDEKKNII